MRRRETTGARRSFRVLRSVSRRKPRQLGQCLCDCAWLLQSCVLFPARTCQLFSVNSFTRIGLVDVRCRLHGVEANKSYAKKLLLCLASTGVINMNNAPDWPRPMDDRP